MRDPASGSRITFGHTRQPRTDLISSRHAFPLDLDRHAPVISHVTEHQSYSRDGALALAEADLQTLAGNTITQSPAEYPNAASKRGKDGQRQRKPFGFSNVI